MQMDPMLERDMLLQQMQYNPGLYNGESYMQQWYQYIYQTQLILAQRKQKRKAETHKTIPCQAWKDTGRCNYGKRCKFAHGQEELRPVAKPPIKMFNNPRYRTALCTKYNAFGYCPYGDQCHFIHDPKTIDLEKCLDRMMTTSPSPPQLSPISISSEYGLDSGCNSGPWPESMEHIQGEDRSDEQLTSGSESESESVFTCDSGLHSESESIATTESMLETDSDEAEETMIANDLETDSDEAEKTMIAYDPFRTSASCKEEIEFKPLHFNVLDDFWYVINPQRVLPKKQ